MTIATEDISGEWSAAVLTDDQIHHSNFACRSRNDSRTQLGERVAVDEVTTRKERREFVDLPWSIYRDDPNWVPPLKREVHAFIDRRRHPFYLHGDAAQFIARRSGEVVGRIMVSDDPYYNAQHGTNLGCFGMFESIDDTNVARRLLDRAADWLRARGRTEVMGPIDYSTNYPSGLLIDGFDTPPRIMMNHHPAYYQALLEGWGLDKEKDLYAWWFEDPHDIISAWHKRAARIAARYGVTVRPARFDQFDQEIDVFKRLYNDTWEDHWGMVRMSDAEFEHLAHSLKQIGIPELMLVAEVNGDPVGVSISLPDINEALAPLNGKLTNCGIPIGLIKLLRNLRKIRSARMAVLGVLEGFRRRGVSELLILQTLDHGKNVLKYTGAELSWTLEDNDMVNRTIERVGAERYKTYRVFGRSLD